MLPTAAPCRRRAGSALLAAAALLTACREAEDVPRTYTALDAPGRTVPAVPGGNADRGAAALTAYGCGACHVIPGVPGATGLVGPSLAGMGRRVYLAGLLPNDTDHLVRWIRHPQAVAPGTAMPDLGVSERDARDMAAYLFTLREISGAGTRRWRPGRDQGIKRSEFLNGLAFAIAP